MHGGLVQGISPEHASSRFLEIVGLVAEGPETMASASSVLAIIRAAHPELKNKHDKLAFAIHAIFLANGYRLVSTGAAEADPEEGRKFIQLVYSRCELAL